MRQMSPVGRRTHSVNILPSLTTFSGNAGAYQGGERTTILLANIREPSDTSHARAVKPPNSSPARSSYITVSLPSSMQQPYQRLTQRGPDSKSSAPRLPYASPLRDARII
jgi:hypothetical protein